MKQPKNPKIPPTVPPPAKKARKVTAIEQRATVHRPNTAPAGPPLPKAGFKHGGNFAAFGRS